MEDTRSFLVYILEVMPRKMFKEKVSVLALELKTFSMGGQGKCSSANNLQDREEEGKHPR